MKRLHQIICSIAVLVSSGAAWADPDLALFEANLKQLYPSTAFKSIRPTKVQGVFEVQMGPSIAYVDATGRYFFVGRLIDMPNQIDLTESRLAEVNKVNVAEFPLADAIKTVKGNGSRTLIVFSDPDCPYCKRLESNLSSLTDTTIYTFLYPLTSLHPDAQRKAVNIWCSANRPKAWAAAMLNDIEAADARCDNPVERTIALGNKLSITGTPTMFSIDGRKRAGAVDATTISAWLDQREASNGVSPQGGQR